MTYKISTLKVRQQLGDILNRVFLRQDEFIIERKGRPLAAVIPIEKMEKIMQLARNQVLEFMDRQAKAIKNQSENSMSEEAVMALANESKRETRKLNKNFKTNKTHIKS